MNHINNLSNSLNLMINQGNNFNSNSMNFNINPNIHELSLGNLNRNNIILKGNNKI